MKMWGYWKFDNCHLCMKENCSLIHILSCCPVALRQKRYSWRHDSVLNTIHTALRERVESANDSPVSVKSTALQRFVRAGKVAKGKAPEQKSHLLRGANDWRLLIDFDESPIVFPPTILSTDLRPDIIIWSEASKIVVWAELTCPAEENMSLARQRKQRRYRELAAAVRHAGWTLHDFTIEVGARGCVGVSFRYFLKKIGMSPTKCRTLIRDTALVVTRASYHIYLASSNPNWVKHALLSASPREEDRRISCQDPP